MEQSSQAPLLATFALTEEARPFVRRVRNSSRIRVLVTGMGGRNAATALGSFLQDWRPRAVLSAGLAGGLDPALATNTVLYDADTEFELTERLAAAGARPGRFHCSDAVLSRASQKAEIRRRTGADAVEMESGAIRALCRESGIPSATVRVILDTATEDLPLDFGALLTREQRIDWVKLAVALLRAPRRVPALLRLRSRTRAAAEELARALGQAVAPVAG